MMEINFTGILIGIACFLSIGLYHPIVIKAEYYFGTRCWWAFLLAGIGFLAGSLFVENDVLSILLGVESCCSLWSILELFQQKVRVEKGWFPMNPRRKEEYGQV